MTIEISRHREPELGLDEACSRGDNSLFSRSSQAKSSSSSSSLRVLGLSALLCLLFLGVFFLGFALGQDWGQKRSDVHWMSLSNKYDQQLQKFSQFERQESSLVKSTNSEALLGEVKAQLDHMHELGEELKLKLINTHNLYAGMIGLPAQIRSLEALMQRWEAGKISLVQDPCPASDHIPRRLPTDVKTAKK